MSVAKIMSKYQDFRYLTQFKKNIEGFVDGNIKYKCQLQSS